MNETGRKKKKGEKTGKRKDEEGQMNERKNVSKKKETEFHQKFQL